MKIFDFDSARPSHRAVWPVVVILGCGLGLGMLIANSVPAQQQPRNSGAGAPVGPRPTLPNIDPLDMPPVYDGSDPIKAKADAKRVQYLNTQRQKLMVAETNRLVKLAADLNAQVNGEQHGQLTPDQVRQLAEIEKLAHNIRDKMSSAVQGAPTIDSSPVIFTRP